MKNKHSQNIVIVHSKHNKAGNKSTNVIEHFSDTPEEKLVKAILCSVNEYITRNLFEQI